MAAPGASAPQQQPFSPYSVPLAKGVKKLVLQEGNDSQRVSENARVSISFLVKIPQEPSVDSSSESSEEERPGSPVHLGSASAMEIDLTLGRGVVVPGVEIALLSMCKGERARVTVPAKQAFDSLEVPQLSLPKHAALEYDLVVRQTYPEVDISVARNRSIVKHVFMEGAPDVPLPQFESKVSLDLMRLDDLTGKLLKQPALVFDVGGVHSDETHDIVASSMRVGEYCGVTIHGEVTYHVRLKTVEPAPRLSDLVKSNSAAWEHARTRTAEAMNLASRNCWAKARRKYLRSAEILMARFPRSLGAEERAHCFYNLKNATISAQRWGDAAAVEEDATRALDYAPELAEKRSLWLARARARRVSGKIDAAKLDLGAIYHSLLPGEDAPAEVVGEVEELKAAQESLNHSGVGSPQSSPQGSPPHAATP